MNTQFLSKISRYFLALALSISFFSPVFAAPPSQVTGVKAILVGENSVSLSWDEATSEEGVVVGYKVYYGTTSVKDEGEVYDDEIEVEAQTSYPIENLTSGMTYYFAVTALDDELNQSENYSEEVSVVIPQGETPIIEKPVTKDPVIEDPIVQKPEEVIEKPVEKPVVIEEPEKPAAPIDIIPPAEAQNLVVDKSTLKNSNSVSLHWQKSANLDGDVADQILYVKKGNENWDNGYSIGKDLEEMVLDVKKDTNYKIKIITVDESGNRSNGVSISFSTETLATSGPGMIIPFAIAAIVMFFFLSFRRRS